MNAVDPKHVAYVRSSLRRDSNAALKFQHSYLTSRLDGLDYDHRVVLDAVSQELIERGVLAAL